MNGSDHGSLSRENSLKEKESQSNVEPKKASPIPIKATGVPPAVHTIPFGLDSTSFEAIDATLFNVRGKNYLKDKIKYPSQESAFDLVELSGFSTSEVCRFAMERSDSYYKRARAAGRKDFIFVMHFDLRPMHTVMIFELKKGSLESDKAFATCFKRFLDGNDEYKNKRLKLITSVVDANWVVKKTIGKPVPALIGNKLSCYYQQTHDMIECTCDVNSSLAASAIVKVVKSACKAIVCDLVVLLEGQAEDELPERVIGGTRYVKHDLSSYQFLECENKCKQ